mgnify:FL=1
MKKNVVFIMNVDPQVIDPKWERFHTSRKTPYELSVKSWKHWCEKNDCELFVLTDLLFPHEEMKCTWQRYYIFDLLEANDINYDQICYVDADTIVHPDCPNFFDMTEGKLCGAHFDGSWDWVLRSIEVYGKYAFENHKIDWYKYIDSGFWIVNEKHKKLFKNLCEYYWLNKDLLKELELNFRLGTDQTPFNYFILGYDEPVDFKLLPYEFNMNDMARKELLADDLLFTKCGWIYQYNAIPNNDDNKLTEYFMKKTYDYLYGGGND